MAGNKLQTYLGFARRAGKLTLGVNAVSTLSGGVYLLVADSSASENTKKEIEKLKKKLSVPVVWTEGLETLTGKEFCKLAAVREPHLAEAILAERED